jgi:hypothetical protein
MSKEAATTFNNIISSKKRSMVDVVENTSTSTFSFNCSCHPDVFRILFMSRSPDVQDVQDVQEVPAPSRHDRIMKMNAGINVITPQNVTSDNDFDCDKFSEIMSVVKTIEVKKPTLMFLEGKVNGCSTRVLLDCDASHNFISEDVIKCHDLQTRSITDVSVTVANEIKCYIDKALMNFELIFDRFHDKTISAYVFPIQSDANYDLILGLPWLITNNLHIDWKTRLITINANNQKYVIKSNNLYKQRTKNNINTIEYVDNFLINAKQLSRCNEV